MKELVREINEKISEYINRRDRGFVPGETPVLTGLAVYDDREVKSVVNSVLGGWFGLGAKGREFEEAFSKRIGKGHSVYVNSGSSANFLALHGIKTKRGLTGGEIITPACGFPTTVNPIIQLGFKPHFIDVDKTLNVTPEGVAAAINKDTVGIVFAHTLGNPARVDEIRKLADDNSLFLIEDCCDALGSRYKGKECGTWSDVCTFSFYPAHIITTGEGGMVSTDDAEINRIMMSLRDWGRDCWCATDEKSLLGACGRRFDFKVNDIPYDHKYIYSQIGYNLKPLELQAAMGLEQLAKLEGFVQARKRNFELYRGEFAGLVEHFDLPEVSPDAEPVFFGLPITIKNPKIRRQELITFLNKNKIATRLLFGGNLIYQPAYKDIDYSRAPDLSNSDNIFENFFWIGIHQGLTEEMIRYVGSKFREFVKYKVA